MLILSSGVPGAQHLLGAEQKPASCLCTLMLSDAPAGQVTSYYSVHAAGPVTPHYSAHAAGLVILLLFDAAGFAALYDPAPPACHSHTSQTPLTNNACHIIHIIKER